MSGKVNQNQRQIQSKDCTSSSNCRFGSNETSHSFRHTQGLTLYGSSSDSDSECEVSIDQISKYVYLIIFNEKISHLLMFVCFFSTCSCKFKRKGRGRQEAKERKNKAI